MEKPIVASMTPDASTVGCRIKVSGFNLADVKSATVGGITCTVEDVTERSLTVVVADDARTGNVVVSNEAGPAGTTPKFTVTVEQEENKSSQVHHHDRVAHKNEQISREAQEWPNQGQKWPKKKKW